MNQQPSTSTNTTQPWQYAVHIVTKCWWNIPVQAEEEMIPNHTHIHISHDMHFSTEDLCVPNLQRTNELLPPILTTQLHSEAWLMKQVFQLVLGWWASFDFHKTLHCTCVPASRLPSLLSGLTLKTLCDIWLPVTIYVSFFKTGWLSLSFSSGNSNWAVAH